MSDTLHGGASADGTAVVTGGGAVLPSSLSTSSLSDMASRLLRVLPSRWFPDTSPVRDAILEGLASVWAAIYAQIQYVALQSKLLTVSGSFLDLAAADFKGPGFLRRRGESDTNFRNRLLPIFPDKATRAALIARVKAVTGNTPVVFEPSRAGDCGGYGLQMGYGIAGRYGSIQAPNQVFIKVARPFGQGLVNAAGYGKSYGAYGGGYSMYGALSLEAPHTTDDDIYAAITDVLPVGSIGWVALTGANANGSTADLGTFQLGVNTLA